MPTCSALRDCFAISSESTRLRFSPPRSWHCHLGELPFVCAPPEGDPFQKALIRSSASFSAFKNYAFWATTIPYCVRTEQNTQDVVLFILTLSVSGTQNLAGYASVLIIICFALLAWGVLSHVGEKIAALWPTVV